MEIYDKIDAQVKLYGEKYRIVITQANDFYNERIRLGMGSEERRDYFIGLIMADVRQGES